MPEPLKVRNRARLREKEAEQAAAELARALGPRPWPEGTHVDKGESQRGEVLVVANRVGAVWAEGHLVPTVRTLLACQPTASFVTVDMGAVKFVNNGADIMGPGIVAADPAIAAGGVAWIRDERNLRPLAVGLALVPGAEMPKQPGKKVKNVHRVGDELWDWEPA